MDCLTEAVATLYMNMRVRVLPPIEESSVVLAEENLEKCRASLCVCEMDLSRMCSRLGREAVLKKGSGDLDAARRCMRTRKMQLGRLDKVRNSLTLVEQQLDTLRSTELDKEIMQSLKLSTEVLRKSGLNKDESKKEVENVMNVLQDQIEEVSDVTELLSKPLTMGASDVEEAELDAELQMLMEDGDGRAVDVLDELDPPMSAAAASVHAIAGAAYITSPGHVSGMLSSRGNPSLSGPEHRAAVVLDDAW